jgi:hypothetical protein
VALASGRASLTTTTLALGEHAVSAEYSGDGNYSSTTLILDSPQMINSPPLAMGDVIQRNPFSGTKVVMNDLLANDYDPDGDPLVLQNIQTTTAEGGTINLAEGWVFYTPPAGFVNADSFTYTLQDSHGASSTATVEIVPRGVAVNHPPIYHSWIWAAEITALSFQAFRGESTPLNSPRAWNNQAGSPLPPERRIPKASSSMISV